MVSSERSALGQDAPNIAPTRLDFDASQAPKNCNDDADFRSALAHWIPKANVRDEADRRLVVRVRRSSNGGKRADVLLVDAQGTILAEWHDDYAAKVDCHKVLWATAYQAAEMLGAFEPPAPKEPLVCPVAPPCLAPPATRSLPPSSPVRTQSIPTAAQAARKAVIQAPPHSFVGIGGFVGTAIYSGLDAGPYFLLGFGVAERWPNVRVEFDTSLTMQELPRQTMATLSIPVVGSFCLVQGTVRSCGGLATTFLYSNQLARADTLQILLAPNIRIGTEWFSRGLFSLRADIFLRFSLAERTFGPTTAAIRDVVPIVGGLALLGIWTAK